MKRLIIIILFLALAALIFQFYQLYLYHSELKLTFTALKKKLISFKDENFRLQADLEYFQETENLEKELRSRFNYKKPGEKLIIVVPQKIE